MPETDRKKALDGAKLALKAYAKEPSETNAARVRSAWEAVSDLQATPIWRRQAEHWLRSGPDGDRT